MILRTTSQSTNLSSDKVKLRETSFINSFSKQTFQLAKRLRKTKLFKLNFRMPWAKLILKLLTSKVISLTWKLIIELTSKLSTIFTQRSSNLTLFKSTRSTLSTPSKSVWWKIRTLLKLQALRRLKIKISHRWNQMQINMLRTWVMLNNSTPGMSPNFKMTTIPRSETCKARLKSVTSNTWLISKQRIKLTPWLSMNSPPSITKIFQIKQMKTPEPWKARTISTEPRCSNFVTITIER